MPLLTASPQSHDEIRRFEQLEVLRHGLTSHVQVFAELAQRLPVVRLQAIEQLPAARVGERLEHLVHVRVHSPIMQPFGCMSSLHRRAVGDESLAGATNAGVLIVTIPRVDTHRYNHVMFRKE